MFINLTEPEIKQAIAEFLDRKLNDGGTTDITLVPGDQVTATVNVAFGGDDVGPQSDTKIPAPDQIKKVVKKVAKPAPKVKVAHDEVPPDAKEETKEVFEKVKEDLGLKTDPSPEKDELDAFGAPLKETTPEVEEEEGPIIEGENVMTENFELASTDTVKVAADIEDDVDDLFNC